MKQGAERELAGRYLERAAMSGKAVGLTGFSVVEAGESRAGGATTRKREEARALRELVPRTGRLVVLDEHGLSMGSEAFARRLAGWRDEGVPETVFAIGGADGLDPDFVKEADLILGFSQLTWPHQLVRIMLAEQLYRATTILSGHPYHRE